MKKLLTMMAAVCALGAYAETELAANYYEFENTTLGEDGSAPFFDGADDDGMWINTEHGEDTVVKAYGEDAKPEIDDWDAGDNYLHIETDGKAVNRAFTDPGNWEGGLEGTPNTVAFGRVFVDTAVKFTAMDSEPTIEDGAQFALWLKATEADEAEGIEGSTNLMVSCGSVDSFGAVTPTSVALDVDVAPDTWHRVTIKPFLESGFGYEDVPGLGCFLVYIDGKLVAAKEYDSVFTELEYTPLKDGIEYANNKQLFPSLIRFDAENSCKLTSLAFNGTGDIDMLDITDEDPFPADEPTPPTAKVEKSEAEGYEAVVKFTALEQGSGYDNWAAKFILIPDVAISEGEIALGGSYAAWQEGAWIDIPFNGCEAGDEISVAGDLNVTVADLFKFVNEFSCGVKNVALKNNATFTLKLVIVNPDNEEDVEELCKIENLKVEKKAEEDPWEEVKTGMVEGFDQLEPAQKEAVQTALNEIAKAVEAGTTGTSAPEDAAGWIEKVYGAGAKVPAEKLAAAKNIDISVKYDLPLMTAETPTIEIKQAVDEDQKPVEGFTFQIKDGDDAVSLEAAVDKIQSMVQFTTALDDETKPFAASTTKNVTVGLSDNKTATATFTKATAAGFMKVELK